MAPRKNQKKEKEKKKGTKTLVRSQPGEGILRKYNRTPPRLCLVPPLLLFSDWTYLLFEGPDGMYQCLRNDNSGHICNRVMTADDTDISSHLSDHHKKAAYHQQMTDGPFSCMEMGCSATPKNSKALVRHYRVYHELRGDSRPLLARYGVVVVPSRRGKKVAQRQTEDQEEDEDENEDDVADDADDDSDSLFVTDHHYPPPDRKDNDDDDNTGNGGSGLGEQILSSNIVAATAGA
jgi:hypothetical protein